MAISLPHPHTIEGHRFGRFAVESETIKLNLKQNYLLRTFSIFFGNEFQGVYVYYACSDVLNS